MTPPKFVLVHSPKGIESAKQRIADDARPKRSRTGFIGRQSSNVLGGFLKGIVGPAIGTFGAGVALPDLDPYSSITATAPPRVTVGIWSLEAWLGDLGRLIGALNGSQNTFVFYEVEATVPGGLISRPERVIPWLAGALGKELDEDTKREIKDNIIADDFFGLADSVRKDFDLDYLIGITASMVATDGGDDGGPDWNDFSTFDGRTILASSYQLQDFSREAGQPVEAFLAYIIVGQLLVARFWPKLGFHDDTGCLFDYDKSRTSLIGKVADPKIDPDCLEDIDPQYRDAAISLLNSVKTFRGAKS